MQSKFEIPLGRGGGQVVSVLALYSDDPSSNPAEGSFFEQFVVEKNLNKQKEAGVDPLKKKLESQAHNLCCFHFCQILYCICHWEKDKNKLFFSKNG